MKFAPVALLLALEPEAGEYTPDALDAVVAEQLHGLCRGRHDPELMAYGECFGDDVYRRSPVRESIDGHGAVESARAFVSGSADEVIVSR